MAGEISGVVTDIDGNPVQGATVYAVKTDIDPAQVAGETTTNSSGNYLFDVPYGGEFTVVAEWDDGGTTYNSRSRSFVDVQASQELNLVFTSGFRNGSQTGETSSYDGFSVTDLETSPAALERFAAGVGGGNLYVAGGRLEDEQGNISTTNVAYVFDGSTWTQITNLPAEIYAAGGAVTPNGDFHVIAGRDRTNNFTQSPQVFVWDGSTWGSIADMPAGRQEPGCASDSSGNIYVAGGDDENYDPINTLFRWDGSSWSTLSTMANNRASHRLEAGPNDNIYAIGGVDGNFDPVGDIEVFDGSSWSVETTLPIPVYSPVTAISDDGTIYVLGGVAGSATLDLQVYDGSSWETEPLLDYTLESAKGGLL